MSYLQGKTILLFGGRGNLGSELQPLLKAKGAVVIAPTSKEVDISDPNIVFQATGWHNPDIVINCAAYTDVPKAQTPEGSREAVKLNVRGSQLVAEAAQCFKAKLVYISTDYVYAGQCGDYSTDEVAPFTKYGITKHMGEWFCDGDKDLIIRTSFKVRGMWGAEKHTKVFHPVYTSGDWVDIIAEMIVNSLEKTGTINVGTERKTLKSLAQQEFSGVEIVEKPSHLGYWYPEDCSMHIEE